MSPAEHYAEAERLLAEDDLAGTSYERSNALQRALVHATLACAENQEWRRIAEENADEVRRLKDLD